MHHILIAFSDACRGLYLVTVYLYLYIPTVCPVSHVADFMEDFGLDRDMPPAQNLREWHRGYIGPPSQRKTSNCDVSVKDKVQHSRDAEGAQSSFCDPAKSGSASLKG